MFLSKHLLRVVVVLIVVFLSPFAEAVEQGQMPPTTQVPNLLDTNRAFDLAEMRGKVVYVDFWASWCGPCLESFPFMARLYQDFEGRGLEILAINIDKNPEDAKRFLEKLFPDPRDAVRFKLGIDPEGKLPSAYGLQTMPSSYLLDRKGLVRYVHAGFRKGDVEKIQKVVSELLAE